MAVVKYKDSFHKQLAKSGTAKTSTSREKMAKYNFDNGLHGFMLGNTVCYDDDSVIGKGGGRKKGQYPQAALDSWTQIAAAMSARFANDRNGKSVPSFKATPGATNPAGTGVPILGFQPDQTPVLMGPPSFPGKAKEAIIKWFKFNYDYACETYKAGSGATDPPNLKEKDKIEKLFNEYYKAAQWGAGGIPLPAIMLDKMRSQPFPEYMPFCKPHKDAPGNTEILEAGKKVKKGALGYVVGEFLSNKQFVEVMSGTEQETVEIDDRGNKEEVGVFKEDAANLDRNEFLIDDDFYLPAIKTALGASYSRFRSNVQNVTGDAGPSGLPIDGKEIVIPGEDGAPDQRLNPPFYNLDRNGNGLTKRATAGGLPNPNFNQPLDDPAYGAAEFDEELQVRHWKNNSGGAGTPLVYGPTRDKGGIWTNGINRTGTRFGDGDGPVKCFMKFVKEDIGTGDNTFPGNDPRSWGPWNEYVGTGTNGETDPVLRKAGLHKLAYKYIVPTGLVTAINAPNTALAHKAVNGAPGFDGACLPAMNKQYWGLRVLEAFPQAKTLEEAIGEALKPPKTDTAGNFVVVPGSDGILDKGGSTFVGGPAPPFIVKEKGSPMNRVNGYKWKFNNDVVLFSGGKLMSGATNPGPKGSPFARGGTPSKGNYRDFSKNLVGINKKIDDRVTGEARGGMTWFDASKQILPPYAPPPLKPPLPNTKPFPF